MRKFNLPFFKETFFPKLYASPLRVPWYRDGTYLGISALTIIAVAMSSTLIYQRVTGKIKPEDIVPEKLSSERKQIQLRRTSFRSLLLSKEEMEKREKEDIKKERLKNYMKLKENQKN